MTDFTPEGKVAVNSITIPPQFVRVAGDWYGGQGCMLYAVSSTGGLTTGTTCPVFDYLDLTDRNEKWYLTLWRALSSDVGRARKLASEGHNGPSDSEDCTTLCEFEDWIDQTVIPLLEDSYKLEDYDG